MNKETAQALRVIIANLRTSPQEEGAQSARLIKSLVSSGRMLEAGEAIALLKSAEAEICAPSAARLFEESLCEEWERH